MTEIKSHSGIYTLTAEQLLPLGLEEAWDFFSSPKNLVKITPPEMGFNITSLVDSKAYSGQIITYKVNVLPFIKMSWVTEITHMIDKKYFIDEQRYGPYSMWHHEHFFEELPDGQTLMKDKISYKIPFGFLGIVAQNLFIKSQLKSIFDYRKKTLDQMFLAQ
jgi:ligand-binding SRPBCC domain-containing protein